MGGGVIRSVAPIVLFANEVLDILDGQRKSGGGLDSVAPV